MARTHLTSKPFLSKSICGYHDATRDRPSFVQQYHCKAPSSSVRLDEELTFSPSIVDGWHLAILVGKHRCENDNNKAYMIKEFLKDTDDITPANSEDNDILADAIEHHGE